MHNGSKEVKWDGERPKNGTGRCMPYRREDKFSGTTNRY
jgi:hypothetical protein